MNTRFAVRLDPIVWFFECAADAESACRLAWESGSPLAPMRGDVIVIEVARVVAVNDGAQPRALTGATAGLAAWGAHPALLGKELARTHPMDAGRVYKGVGVAVALIDGWDWERGGDAG